MPRQQSDGLPNQRSTTNGSWCAAPWFWRDEQADRPPVYAVLLFRRRRHSLGQLWLRDRVESTGIA
jgi:hypothetical protein